MRVRISMLEKQGTCKPTNTKSVSFAYLHVLNFSNMSSSPIDVIYPLNLIDNVFFVVLD
ncbi:unnamed protein product [Arabidopsis thaliana]|uniref:(thale cress) hypothetical protein n=1 Tax=Arabidopsis thaliana TaxID=3702 RepID=A0A7G2EEG1_ARATH|nr:unnamed protein product [Arabidopsis thaliana]